MQVCDEKRLLKIGGFNRYCIGRTYAYSVVPTFDNSRHPKFRSNHNDSKDSDHPEESFRLAT
jgi:hypothetical protein